jgi:hypothetical protein
MEKVPFLGVLAQVYKGTESLWQQFRADVISLLALGIALYWADFRIHLPDLNAAVLALSAKLNFSLMMKTDGAKDIALGIILAIMTAVTIIAIQSVLRLVGEFCLNLIHFFIRAVHRHEEPNVEAMAIWAARLPADQRSWERIYYGYREAGRFDAEVEKNIDENGWVRYCSSRAWEAARITQNAAAFLFFAWLPGYVAAAFPDAITLGNGGALFWYLAGLLLLAEWHLRRMNKRLAFAAENAIDDAMKLSKGWVDAVNAVLLDRETYFDLAKQARDKAKESRRPEPSLWKYLRACLNKRLRDSRLPEAKAEIARSYDELRRRAGDFEDHRVREDEQQPRGHLNYDSPKWLEDYFVWRLLRLGRRLRWFAERLSYTFRNLLTGV